MILTSSIKKKVPLFFLILLLGVVPTFSEKENSNYYLGVLARGYPPSLVANEFRFANARVVNIKDNMVLFGINEKTKLTTFLKNLPFLAEVYADAADIKGDDSLKKNPLVREFLFLLQRNKTPDITPPPPGGKGDNARTADKAGSAAEPGLTPGKQGKQPVSKGNMALIDQLIREKAKKIRAKKGAEK